MNDRTIRLTWSKSTIRSLQTDTLACFVHGDEASFSKTARALARAADIDIESALAHGDFKGKANEVIVAYPRKGKLTKRVILVGLGPRKGTTIESLRKAGAAAAKKARSMRSGSLAIWMPSALPPSFAHAFALAEGAWLSLYRYNKYVTPPAEDPPIPLTHIHLASDDAKWIRHLPKAADHCTVICEATCLARDLSNAPASELYPETLAQAAQESSDRCGYAVTIWTEAELLEKGMGGVLAVGQGSARPPRFLVLEHGDSTKRPIVLIGKGVCFDSGGISIKPSSGMAEMKMDMAGAAAVIGAFEAVSRLDLNVHIIGLIPAVENMPGGKAQKPGDIIRHFGGKTSEVDNTDAEGRLILADAIAYAETLKPIAIIDLATLTGAVVVALGHVATGMLGTDQRLMDELRKAGEATYERVWQLPMFSEYEKLIKSDVADVKNVGGRWAGTITAAFFLKTFVASTPWVHLDIAGTAMVEEQLDYIPRGGSGVGVRLLTEFLRSRTK